MKIQQTLSLFLITISLHSQSITFGPTTTLFNLDGAHWALSQPMIPTASSDGKHVDFYGLTGSTYKKHTHTAGSYSATSFMLFGDFNYITDVHDFDGDGMDDILTDYDIFKNLGNNTYERHPFGNINYKVEGSLDFDGDGLLDVVISEEDFFSSLSSLYVFKNKGNFVFEKIIIEQNIRIYRTVTTADVNGDGKGDIITINKQDNRPFTVFMSNGDGTASTINILGDNDYYLKHDLSLVDMDKDGDLDIIAMDFDNGLRFIENKDNFMTNVKVTDNSFDAIIDPLFVHGDDLNGDGWIDIIVGTLTNTKLTVYIGQGTGPFQFDDLQELGTLKGGTSDFGPDGRATTRMVHTIDINDDGKKDIVFTSTFDKKQVAWINKSILSHTTEHVSPVSFYPNPVCNELVIQTNTNVTVSVFNINGQTLLKKTVGPSDYIDMSAFNTGIYLAEIKEADGKISMIKFLKE